MLPDKLPPVVMDNIFSFLGNPDLVALCRTCKAIYASAIKALYSKKWPKNGKRKLRQSLALNPDNAKYLREYHCTNIQQLSQVLAKQPLRLERLKLYFNERQISAHVKKKFHEAVAGLVSSMHPNTSIEEIDCSLTNPALLYKQDIGKIEWVRLLEKFHAFRNLESVILKCREFGDRGRCETFGDIQTVIDQLSNCLQLSRITFIDAEINMEDWRVDLGVRLPSLRGIRFHYKAPIGLPEITEAVMRDLEVYKDRGVYFQVTAKSYSEQYVQFYDAALRLNKETRNFFIEWLVYGEQYFQIEVNKNDKFILDLGAFKPKERDKILTVVKKLSLKYDLGIKMNLYARDSDILYFPDPTKESAMLKNLLHPRITSLDLSVKQSIHTKFIPSLIQTLENLSDIVVILLARKPVLEDDCRDEDEGVHDGCCERILDPGAWCTRAVYSVALSCYDLEKSVRFNLELKVKQKPRWTIFEHHDCEEHEWPDQEILKGMETRNAEIQKELTTWFKLNSRLRSINFRVFAGEPW